MYFNVYFDPQVVNGAFRLGEAGLPLLLSIWRGFYQNCFIAEFTEHLIQPDLDAELNKLPETSDRSVLKKIIKQIANEHRFVYCLDLNDSSDCLSAFESADRVDLIDLILVEGERESLRSKFSGQIEQLVSYGSSKFEESRNSIASNGVVHPSLSIEAYTFLDRYLKRGLANAQRIELIDKLLLLKYKQNFRYSLQHLFSWFERNIAHPHECEIVIHTCYKADASEIVDLRSDLQSFRIGRLDRLKLRLVCYDGDYNDALPHDRFIVTNQVGLVIPRGFDLFHKGDDGKPYIRDVTMNTMSKKDIEQLIALHKKYQLPDVSLEIV